MLPFFNTSGPCIPGKHYMLSPERRLHDVPELIEAHRYFTLHAGCRTGRTTSAMWLKKHLDATGRWRVVRVDLAVVREEPDVARAMTSILKAFDDALGDRHSVLVRPDANERARMLSAPDRALLDYLEHLARHAPLPLAILCDAVDGLVGEAMVSFLAQLRHGYLARSRVPFPASVVLVGQLRVRDRQTVAWLGTTSPFDFTAKAETLGPFAEPEVGELLAQHTMATGQRFSADAVARIWELGRGQPWLTNALADQIVRRDVKDRTAEIMAAHVEAAKETLILERRTHIDSLVARLREEGVRRIVAPMLVGDRATKDVLDDDFAYVLELGLIRAHAGRYEIANPIYAEVLPRAIIYDQQVPIANEPAWYVRTDGGLDMAKLMAAWRVFWRMEGHLAAEAFSYREAGPHLMLMAFLQRVVDGGGRIECEYGLGRGALDLMVEWRGQRHAIEVKLRRDTETEEDALDQVAGYFEHAGLHEGWLVMFDLRKGPSWGERLYVRKADQPSNAPSNFLITSRAGDRCKYHHVKKSSSERVRTKANP